MPEIREIAVYKFEELSPKAKENALAWWARVMGDEWAEYVIDNAKEDGKKRGFIVEHVRWSGFWSQGDGASWTGCVNLPKFIEAGISPDHRLFARAQVYAMLVQDGWVDEEVPIAHRSFHYSHSGTMSIEEIDDAALVGVVYESHYGPEEAPVIVCECPLKGADVRELALSINAEDLARELMDEMLEQAKSFADDVYGQLEDAFNHETSEENFAEIAAINEYRFTEDGEPV